MNRDAAPSPLHRLAIRWIVREDTAAIMAIARACFDYPLTEDDLWRYLTSQTGIGHVATCDSEIVGYMLHRSYSHLMHLWSIAVHPNWQRCGIGAAMAQYLDDKLRGSLRRPGRDRILTEVRESNLVAQLFLRSQGFRATGVMRNFYADTDEAAYLMEQRLSEVTP